LDVSAHLSHVRSVFGLLRGDDIVHVELGVGNLPLEGDRVIRIDLGRGRPPPMTCLLRRTGVPYDRDPSEPEAWREPGHGRNFVAERR